MNILKCGDQNFWAYHFLTQEQAKYSKYNIKYAKHDQVIQDIDWADIIYIHSPDITSWHAKELPLIATKKNKKVITQYSGNPKFWSDREVPIYSYSDLVITISPQLYQFAKKHYYNIPAIYLPESVDTNFFVPKIKVFSSNNFVVGWAGGAHKRIKRSYLLKRLDFPIQIQDTWNDNRYNKEEKTLCSMRDFYQSIDCLIITSLSECMPRVVMEAMSCGIPVIGTDVGSMRLLLDNKFIVPVNPEEETIKEINKLLYLLKDDYNYRKHIGEINRIKACNFFSWKSNTYLWDKMFELVYTNKTKNIVPIAENWLNKFRKEFEYSISQIIEKTDGLIDKEIKDIINYLNDNKIYYYLLDSSCLDCIKHQQLYTEKNKLYLGGDLKSLQNILIKCGFEIKENVYIRKNVIIALKDFFCRRVKIVSFYDLPVKVPFPVILYLDGIYGTGWQPQQ